MSDVPDLARALRLIDQKALSVILEPLSEEQREGLCALIREYRPLLAADHPSGDTEMWRKKALGVGEEILAVSDALRGKADRNRLGLIVSYVRTMRSFIAKLLSAAA
jgi:hypothetical protein